jgi:hypothetical protein
MRLRLIFSRRFHILPEESRSLSFRSIEFLREAQQQIYLKMKFNCSAVTGANR